MTMLRRCLALPLAGVLIFSGACDDGDGGPATSTTEHGDPEARARAINLTLQDLPEEFVAVPSDAQAEDDNVVQACVGDIADDVVAEGETPLFQRPSGEGVQFLASSTAVLSDEETATDLLAALQQETTVNCLRDSFAGALIEESAAEGLQEASLADATGVPDFGEQSEALAGSLRFTAPGTGQPVTLDYTLVLVRTDTIVSFLLYGGLLDTFPPELLTELTRLVAQRQ